MRILIADELRDTVLTLGILFRSEGFEVRTLTSPAALQTAVRIFEPHAVVLDGGTPGSSGREMAQQLTEALGEDCPPLIHFTRPYDPDDLLAQVAALRQ